MYVMDWLVKHLIYAASLIIKIKNPQGFLF
jgi:hypothetical protein